MTTKTETIVLLGGSYSGKSTILDYYVSDQGLSYEMHEILPTIGVDRGSKITIGKNGEKIKKFFIDTSG